jgi:CheY-like chemotaxis protein
VLRSAGYQVDTATSAAEGLALIRAVLPDLIITDVMMSYSMEGVDLTCEVARDSDLAHIPLFVVTSIARTLDLAGFDRETAQAVKEFFTKPVSPGDLLTRVGCYLSDREE